MTWLPAARLNDTYALAVKGDGPIAARTLSELAAAARGRSPAPGCASTPRAASGRTCCRCCSSVYGIAFADTTQLGHSLIPPAVAEGRCAAGIVYSTAALIVKHGLRVLEDDKVAFGAYTPAPTVLDRAAVPLADPGRRPRRPHRRPRHTHHHHA